MTSLDKLGVLISWAGIISFAMLAATDMDDSITVCCIIGCFCSILGARVGWKIWDLDQNPMGLFFMSDMDIFNNRFTSAIMWAIRFFFIPLIFWSIIQIIIA